MKTDGQRELGHLFETVRCRVEHGRSLPLTGDLEVRDQVSRSAAAIVPRCNGASVGRARRVFEVHGNDMLDEGIRSGDRLLIEPRTAIADGATVLVDIGGRFAVKRFYREPDAGIRLVPANPDLLPLVLRADRVRIRGVVIGLFRRHGFRRRDDLDLRKNGAARLSAPERRRPRSDLAYRLLQENVDEWSRITALPTSSKRGAGSMRMRELGRTLRALVATYATLSNQRLRRALLEEASRISREMRAVAAARGAPASRIRPLV